MYQQARTFKGEFFHQLDEKARIKLPARLLENLLDNFGRDCLLVRMPERCVAIYPKSTWEEGWARIHRKMGSTVPGSADSRALTRITGATSLEVQIAAQGRVSLPEGVRRYLGIDAGDSVAIVGAEDRIEIWKEENWFNHLDSLMEMYEEIAERTTGLVNGNGADRAAGEKPEA